MRHHLLVGIALLPALLAMPVFAEDLVKTELSSQLRVELQEPGVFRIHNTTRRYETNIIAATADRTRMIHQILEIEQTVEQVEGPEIETQFGPAEIAVSAYPLADQGKGEKSFTVKAPGDAVRVSGPYLTITKYGCCAEQSTNAVFSLENGAYLFNATGEGESGDWVTMGARGGFDNERIIAYHAVPTTYDLEILKEIPNAVVAITYAKRNEALQRVAVIASQAAIDADAELNWWGKAGLVSATQTEPTDRIFVEREGTGAELFTDATYRLVLDEETVIEIPLTADRLDIAKAKLPAGFSLVEMKLDGQPY